jgi:hypothetical protein
MDTHNTGRISRQREAVAFEVGPALDLIAEHEQGTVLDELLVGLLVDVCGIPMKALQQEHDGRTNPLRLDTIVPCGRDRFEFARYARCAGEAVRVFTLLAFSPLGNAVDIVAWRPGTSELLTRYRWAVMLVRIKSTDRIWGEDLLVHRSVYRFLLDQRRGIVVLDRARAALALHGTSLIPEDKQHRRELRKLLTFAPTLLRPAWE